MPYKFLYNEAFARNIGWLTEREQQVLRHKRVAIAGLGGVGGVHLLTLARLGIGNFNIADFDAFDLANFNRQAGASMSNLGRAKADVMATQARDINPEIDLRIFPNGVTAANLSEFLADVDVYVDGLDFFAFDARELVFAACSEYGIPAVTVAPLGMGAALLNFVPGKMTFEDYFQWQGQPDGEKALRFLLGLSPALLQRAYLMDTSRVNFAARKGPSTVVACQLCAGVAAAEVTKILLGRGQVRAAPHGTQFDAYRVRHAHTWRPGGNRNPLQRIALAIARRQLNHALSTTSFHDTPTHATVMESILDLARWAPSGDNNQPWRFEIISDTQLRVHARSGMGEDVYDYRGQPSLLAFGFLLESIRLAATRFGRNTHWTYAQAGENKHLLSVDLPADEAISEDPLLELITLRSVDRRRYRTTPLSSVQKHLLESALGVPHRIIWFESTRDRWRIARINALATRIRLSIPEAFVVHQRILDFSRRMSPDGVPASAIGLDPLLQRIMQPLLRNWQKMRLMNRWLGGTIMPCVEMDLLPGLGCGAHFMVLTDSPPDPAQDPISVIRSGQSMQRFWLTATQCGLVMQPSLAPLCFAHYGAHHLPFTSESAPANAAENLALQLQELIGGDVDRLIFMGRVGYPATPLPTSRSLRKPLSELLVLPQENFADQ